MQHILNVSRSPQSLGGLLQTGSGLLPETCKKYKYRNKTSNGQCRRERSLHKRGCFGKMDPGNLSFLCLQGGGSLLGGSTLRLLRLASVGSVRGGALPLSRQRDIVVGHDREFLHLWIVDLGSKVVLIQIGKLLSDKSPC